MAWVRVGAAFAGGRCGAAALGVVLTVPSPAGFAADGGVGCGKGEDFGTGGAAGMVLWVLPQLLQGRFRFWMVWLLIAAVGCSSHSTARSEGTVMVDEARQSIFDVAKGSASFPIARRGGYEPTAVNAWARTQEAELARAGDQIAELRSEHSALTQQVAALREQLETAGRPSYASLGDHAAQLLKLSEQEAADVRSRAKREAAELLSHAQDEAAATRTAATREVDTLRASTIADLEARKTALANESAAAKAEINAHAQDSIAQAEREAAQIRLSAEQEAETLLKGAQREAEQSRAAADREVTEARRVLAVEKERLAREATDAHEAAASETAKLISDADARAAAADDRARETQTQAAAAREAAAVDVAKALEDAKSQAEAIVAQAKSEADHVRATASSDLERQTRTLRGEVEDLQERRAAILAQLGQIRDIVGGVASDPVREPEVVEEAEDDEDDAPAPAETAPAKPSVTQQPPPSGPPAQSARPAQAPAAKPAAPAGDFPELDPRSR